VTHVVQFDSECTERFLQLAVEILNAMTSMYFKQEDALFKEILSCEKANV
jgi:hypothetical protein